MGRLRTIHWGSRSLDLDLLLCGGCRIDSPELILPHPRPHHPQLRPRSPLRDRPGTLPPLHR